MPHSIGNFILKHFKTGHFLIKSTSEEIWCHMSFYNYIWHHYFNLDKMTYDAIPPHIFTFSKMSCFKIFYWKTLKRDIFEKVNMWGARISCFIFYIIMTSQTLDKMTHDVISPRSHVHCIKNRPVFNFFSIKFLFEWSICGLPTTIFKNIYFQWERIFQKFRGCSRKFNRFLLIWKRL